MVEDIGELLTVKDIAKKYYCSVEVARTMLSRGEVAKWIRYAKKTDKYVKCRYIWNEISCKDIDYVFSLKGYKRNV